MGGKNSGRQKKKAKTSQTVVEQNDVVIDGKKGKARRTRKHTFDPYVMQDGDCILEDIIAEKHENGK